MTCWGPDVPDTLELLADLLAPALAQKQAREYGLTLKHDASTTPASGVYSHGPGGLLTWPGVNPDVFNAAMGPMSILSQLPTLPTNYMTPTYFTLTGVKADTGSEPATPCDDGVVAGIMKGCMTTSVFGRYDRETPVLDLARLGQLNDRADPMDLRIIGSPLALNGPFAGLPGSASPADVLTNEISRKFWERNVSFHRLLAHQLWKGNPSNSNAGGGYKEMTGLDTLINTGYVDAETGSACAAVDSYVVDLNYLRIDANSTTVVARITDMKYQLDQRAMRSGLAPVRWVIAMRPQMFYELTAIWPCTYLSFRCMLDGSSANRNTIDAADAIRFRDEMRAGKYLLIDGERVEVVVDDGIVELDGNTSGGHFPKGCFSADIYFIPMSVVGGQSVLYLEYFQFQNAAMDAALQQMVLGRVEGAFFTYPKQKNMCVQWASIIEPRLVLRTPWLAGRIKNVVYCPIQHEREPFPEDPYFVNGGKSERVGPSYYKLWQT